MLSTWGLKEFYKLIQTQCPPGNRSEGRGQTFTAEEIQTMENRQILTRCTIPTAGVPGRAAVTRTCLGPSHGNAKQLKLERSHSSLFATVMQVTGSENFSFGVLIIVTSRLTSSDSKVTSQPRARTGGLASIPSP